MNSPPTIGSVISPAMVGVKLRAIWKYCPRNTAPPNIAVPTATVPMVASVTVELRNIRSGTIGSLTLVSITTAMSRASRPPPT